MTLEFRKARRAGTRAMWWIGLAAILMVVIGVVRFVFSFPAYRQSIVLVDSGLHVASFDSKMSKVTVMGLPEDFVIQTAMGYGQYAVRSVISLDSIDHMGGELIMASIERALGIPISGYVIVPDITEGVFDLQKLRHALSFPSMGERITGRLRTSLSVIEWMRFVFATQRLSSDAVRSLSFDSAAVNQTAADGGSMLVFDTDRADYIIGTDLFDAGIRSEGLTVALYNTTDVPALGGSVSRILARMGMQMVFVGNVDQAVGRCRISGSREHLATKTANFIRKHYSCETSGQSSLGGETGADIVVLIGNEYASRYKAPQKP